MTGIIYTNTSSKKRKQKKTASQIKAEAEHAAFLQSVGVGKNKNKKTQKPAYKYTAVPRDIDNTTTLDSIKGTAPKRKENVYSGERKLIGVAVMHKSCLQPIFTKQDAIDSSKMGQ